MITVDEPAVPQRAIHELRAEVAQRSGRFRRRRLVRTATLTGGAIALAVVVFAATLDAGPDKGGPTRVDSERGPAGEGRVSTTAQPATEAASGDASTPSVQPLAPRTPRPRSRPAPAAAGPAPSPTKLPQVMFADISALYVSSVDNTGRRKVSDTSPWEGRWSPDTRYLLEYATNLDVYDLHDGSRVRTVFTARDTTMDGDDTVEAAAWMPDSRTIAFARYFDDLETDGRYELWTVDIHTRALRRIRSFSRGVDAMAVTADGRIAYNCRMPAGPDAICFTDLSGRDLGRVQTLNMNWDVSPDGRWIAWGDTEGVYLVGMDGTKRTLIRTTTWYRVAFYPDGSRVAFSLDWADKEPKPCNTPRPCPNDGGIWSVTLEGTDARQIASMGKAKLIGVEAAP